MDSKAFEDGGVYILQSGPIYMMALAQKVGVHGVGPHRHNDWLSFDLCINGLPVVIDPGTYCYTGNLKEKNLFRSTAYHNTVVVDGQEQIPIENSIFALGAFSGDIVVEKWRSEYTLDYLAASHSAYERLRPPVTHRRCFTLNKVYGQVLIQDEIITVGRHKFESYMHLSEKVDCRLGAAGVVVINQGYKDIATIEFDESSQKFCIEDGWISHSYNRRRPGKILKWIFYGDVNGEMITTYKISCV